MKIFHSDAHRLHDVPTEFNRGQLVPAYERPSRADNVRVALSESKIGPMLPPQEFPLDHAYAVQDRGLVDFMKGAYAEWESLGRNGILQPIAAPIRNLRN